jgi:uncharacterized protein YdaU (DUF1376 family)
MHYYQHHIGDFQRDTASLSDSDTLAYLRLLWMYYDTEQPLPNDPKKLAFRIGSDSDAVQMLLEAFFVLENGVWNQKRCDAEIANYRAKSDRARNANEIRWQSKRDLKSDPNKIATKNQEPIIKTKAIAVARPDDVDQKVWDDFLQIRKAKRSPITETALTAIRKQADKAGLTVDQALRICCARGWQGFEAEWVKPDDRKSIEVDKPGFFMGRKLAGGGNG